MDQFYDIFMNNLKLKVVVV